MSFSSFYLRLKSKKNESFLVIMGVSVPVVDGLVHIARYLNMELIFDIRKLLRSYYLEDQKYVNTHATHIKLSQLFWFTG